MEIRRQGSNRKVGWISISSKKAPVTQIIKNEKGNLSLSITIKKTIDLDRSGEYDYDVRLSLEDLKSILDLVAVKGVEKHQTALMEGLEESVRSLTRLTAIASGIPIKESDPKG